MLSLMGVLVEPAKRKAVMGPAGRRGPIVWEPALGPRRRIVSGRGERHAAPGEVSWAAGPIDMVRRCPRAYFAKFCVNSL